VRQYIGRRLLQSVVILFLLSVAVFIVLRVAPTADPALIRCGLMCRDEQYQALREDMGLDDPLIVQYATWGKQVITGSLGRDFQGNSVRHELRRRLPVTGELLLITILITLTLGLPFGIISALYRNSPPDYLVRLVAILGLAVPSFWLATLAILVPQVLWDYAPPLTRTIALTDSPADNLRQFLPAAVILGAVSSAGVMRLTRSSMLEVMRQDYIRTARAKGLRQQVLVWRHALKNALIPVVTILGLQIAGLFGGSVIVERVFNLEGVGQYFLSALAKSDYPVVQSLTLYIGTVVVLMNLTVDVVYAWLDPRIRYT